MKAYQRNIINLRKEHGFTQAELCEKAGLAIATYRRLETGKREPLLKDIVALCALYDCTPNYLLCDHSAPESEIFPPYRHGKNGTRTKVRLPKNG